MGGMGWSDTVKVGFLWFAVNYAQSKKGLACLPCMDPHERVVLKPHTCTELDSVRGQARLQSLQNALLSEGWVRTVYHGGFPFLEVTREGITHLVEVGALRQRDQVACGVA
jgi:hypothetical protein